MNSTTTDIIWGPGEIASIVNLGLTFLIGALNLHQSYRHRHLHSTCFGHDVLVCDSDTSSSPRAKAAPVP